MIAADTSSFLAFLSADQATDTHLISRELANRSLCFPGPVVSELCTYDRIGELLQQHIGNTFILNDLPGYWERSGRTRRLLIQHSVKLPVETVLIAQACIDHEVHLISRDPVFRHFVKHCGLKLAL